jgi:hypothetical protein
MNATHDGKCAICNNHPLSGDGKCIGCLQLPYLCTCKKEEFREIEVERSDEFVDEEERGGLRGL